MHKIFIIIIIAMTNYCYSEDKNNEYSPIVTEESRKFSLSEVGKTKEVVKNEQGKPEKIDDNQWCYPDPLKIGSNSCVTRKRYLFKNDVVIGVVSEKRDVGCIYVAPVK